MRKMRLLLLFSPLEPLFSSRSFCPWVFAIREQAIYSFFFLYHFFVSPSILSRYLDKYDIIFFRLCCSENLTWPSLPPLDATEKFVPCPFYAFSPFFLRTLHARLLSPISSTNIISSIVAHRFTLCVSPICSSSVIAFYVRSARSQSPANEAVWDVLFFPNPSSKGLPSFVSNRPLGTVATLFSAQPPFSMRQYCSIYKSRITLAPPLCNPTKRCCWMQPPPPPILSPATSFLPPLFQICFPAWSHAWATFFSPRLKEVGLFFLFFTPPFRGSVVEKELAAFARFIFTISAICYAYFFFSMFQLSLCNVFPHSP